MAIDMLVGRTRSSSVTYVQEQDGGGDRPFQAATAHLTVRDWRVTDPEARLREATEVLGMIDERNRFAAQWFIDVARNTAVLLVFRPSKFTGV